MRVAIRYQSRGGHVKEMAEIIQEGAGVEPISVDDPRAPIKKPVDVLFIGGALYAFKLDPSMEEFIKSIPEGMVRLAIVFGSSALTRRPIYLMQERLKAKGIDIHPMALYMRGKPKPYLREIVPPWAKKELEKIEKQIEEGTYGEQPKAPIVQMIENAEKKKAAKKVEVAASIAEGTAKVAEAAANVAEKASEAADKAIDEALPPEE
ncbi:MAG: hypothetical protein IKG18_04310 [Atopobiaceae bacterium]|nr:hypothetical protein [Atopobiaceae bacterium]MBR3313344.1 hypothetical protein [Atopobiaceae bacterium]